MLNAKQRCNTFISEKDLVSVGVSEEIIKKMAQFSIG